MEPVPAGGRRGCRASRLRFVTTTSLFDGHDGATSTAMELIRSTDDEKAQQIANVEAFRRQRNPILMASRGGAPPAGSLAPIFASLIEAVKFNSLGQISHALYDVGGEYRRSM